ncbi:MAG: sigma-70 family RNA polymerase sigma factor [Bacteroidetes bacterium]|nr:sigma-70 family RNA polymerase sigma factor [Bacteroidota bacterium]MBU1484201.1 sigma-70 family RNA polymerase sigma factor [Bacteroidota bacterium]MBU2047159.1 sigma-70 family RNA polymerase sigma factor [Bacteroidota bacterium]MBU2267380.1 sigma-70 family RNA polymerase sigma factor [Bacteroidota bacterium]MBU2375842.1 sigma-70 family RNA polymerase sigma factor [Bacteroidota bacterium]
MIKTKKLFLEEAELVEALKSQKKVGADALYEMYAGSLMGIVSRVISDTEIAEDVLQETFVKIWNSIQQYDPTKGRLFTWMVNVARNLAIDKVRSKDYRNHSKNQDLENHVNDIDETRNSTYKPELLGVKNLVQKLRPEQQIIVDMIYFKGYTHVEVADELAIPLGTVKTRLRMGIIELRKYFK